MGSTIRRGSTGPWPESVIIHTDGASRGNPGIASLGLAVYDESENLIFEQAETLGLQTNNFAEYMAVIRSLELAQAAGVKRLLLKTDSQLLVRQLSGDYKVKSEVLKPLYEKCKLLRAALSQVRFQHVRREENKVADALANEVLDQ